MQRSALETAIGTTGLILKVKHGQAMVPGSIETLRGLGFKIIEILYDARLTPEELTVQFQEDKEYWDGFIPGAAGLITDGQIEAFAQYGDFFLPGSPETATELQEVRGCCIKIPWAFGPSDIYADKTGDPIMFFGNRSIDPKWVAELLNNFGPDHKLIAPIDAEHLIFGNEVKPLFAAGVYAIAIKIPFAPNENLKMDLLKSLKRSIAEGKASYHAR